MTRRTVAAWLMVMCSALVSASAPTARMRLPASVDRKLSNGIQVYVVRRPGVPLIDVAIGVRGGKESEPVSLPGLSSVTGDLLRKGTARYTASEFSAALDALGGSYNVRADEQMTLIESEFLTKDISEGLTLVADAVLHPTFPDQEVTKILGERRDNIKALKDNPRVAISPYAHTFFFGGQHPYGRIIDEESVSRLTRSAISDYHRRMYCGNNLVLAIVGDVNTEAILRSVEQVFGNVPAGNAYAWMKPIPLTASSVNRLLLVDKPGSTQTYFYIAQGGISATDPDRVPLLLVNTLFGGRFTSMLNDELRVKAGLTYGAANRFEENRLQGLNTISTYTKTESTHDALALSTKILSRFITNGITEEQLSSAKAYLKGTLPRQLIETGDQIARELVRLNALGAGRDRIDQMFDRIDAVTLEQANTVIRRHFTAEGLCFVLVGDATRIRTQVKEFAPQIDEVSISKAGFAPHSD